MEPSAPAQQSTDRWPGAFGVFKPSLRTVAFNLAAFLLTVAVSFVIQFVFTSIDSASDSSAIAIVVQIATLVISIFFAIATTYVLLDASESKKIDFKSALQRSKAPLLPYIGLSILTGIIVIASFVALIIPFFFIAPRLILAGYYMLDQKKGVIDSLKTSWAETRGHVGKVYGIVGVNLLMCLLFLTIIGIPVAIFLLVAYSAATVLLYKYIVTGKLKDPIAAPIETPVPTA